MDQNPWQVLISVWRNAILASWRLPLLIAGCLLLYTFLSAFWLRETSIHPPARFIPQAGYILLQSLVFAPLVVGVMLTAQHPRIRYSDVWSAAAIPIAAVIALRDAAMIAGAMALRALRPTLILMLGQQRLPFPVAALLYVLPAVLLLLAIFLLSVRLILLLPIMALEDVPWRTAITRAWHSMIGHYGFALAVSLAVILPLAVAERTLIGVYRGLYRPGDVLGPLPLRQWEALTIRSAELTLEYVIIAALAAGLYLAIRQRAVFAGTSSVRADARPGMTR